MRDLGEGKAHSQPSCGDRAGENDGGLNTGDLIEMATKEMNMIQ